MVSCINGDVVIKGGIEDAIAEVSLLIGSVFEAIDNAELDEQFKKAVKSSARKTFEYQMDRHTLSDEEIKKREKEMIEEFKKKMSETLDKLFK